MLSQPKSPFLFIEMLVKSDIKALLSALAKMISLRELTEEMGKIIGKNPIIKCNHSADGAKWNLRTCRITSKWN